MPSKYSASIKVRLSRVVNIAVLIMSIVLVVLVMLVFFLIEAELIRITIDELSDLRKAGLYGTIYERGSQISDQF